MSALGDFIYSAPSVYMNKEGANFKQMQDYQNYQSYVAKRNVKEISDDTIKEIKHRLKINSQEQVSKDRKEEEIKMQTRVNTLYEYFASITSTSTLGHYVSTSKKGISYSGDYSKLKKKTLNQNDISQLKKEKEQLDKELSKINNNLISSKELEIIVAKYKHISKYKPDTSNLQALQESINDLHFYTWISDLTGSFGEHVVAAIDDEAKNQAENNLINFVKSKVVGKNTNTIYIDKTLINESAAKFLTNAVGDSYYIGTSQNKVDVEITVNAEDVFANVKNYYDNSKITLQSEIRLLDSLTFLNQWGDFGNHWINLHNSQSYSNTKFIENKQKADSDLFYEFAFEALSGGNPLKKAQNNANVFISFDRKTGEVEVIKVSHLLNKNNDLFKRFHITPSIQNKKLNLRRDVGSILQTINNIKYHAYLKKLDK